jgi:hypothetical protein
MLDDNRRKSVTAVADSHNQVSYSHSCSRVIRLS